MYRIGVDARLLSEAVTGIGRYTFEMLTRLVPRDHDWTLLSHRPLTVGDWNRPNVRMRTANLPGRVLRMAWAQSVLPRWAAQAHVDLFWAPTHRLPRHLPERIARVVTVHDLVWKHAGETMRPTSRFLDSRLMPEAARLADRVIAVSQHTASDLIEEMPALADKVRVVPLGVSSLPAPATRESLVRLGVDRPYFLFVGTLEPRKNLRRLLQAYAALPDGVRRRALLVIVGGRGWGGVDAPALVDEFHLGDDVRIVGYANEEVLATLYAHALFLAMPSLYEGFGLPLTEAMSLGTPVITSNRASMPEVAGDAGLLVEPTDVNSISDAIATLLTDDARRTALAVRATASAARFSWQRAVDETLKIFDEAVQARREKLA